MACKKNREVHGSPWQLLEMSEGNMIYSISGHSLTPSGTTGLCQTAGRSQSQPPGKDTSQRSLLIGDPTSSSDSSNSVSGQKWHLVLDQCQSVLHLKQTFGLHLLHAWCTGSLSRATLGVLWHDAKCIRYLPKGHRSCF